MTRETKGTTSQTRRAKCWEDQKKASSLAAATVKNKTPKPSPQAPYLPEEICLIILKELIADGAFVFLTKKRDVRKVLSKDTASFFALVPLQAANAAFRSKMEFEAARIAYTGKVFRFCDIDSLRFYLNSAKTEVFRQSVKHIHVDTADRLHEGWDFRRYWRNGFMALTEGRLPKLEKLEVVDCGSSRRLPHPGAKRPGAKCTHKTLKAMTRIQSADERKRPKRSRDVNHDEESTKLGA